jgi:hypothetical protein
MHRNAIPVARQCGQRDREGVGHAIDERPENTAAQSLTQGSVIYSHGAERRFCRSSNQIACKRDDRYSPGQHIIVIAAPSFESQRRRQSLRERSGVTP